MSVSTYPEDLIESRIKCLFLDRCFLFAKVNFVRNKVTFDIAGKSTHAHKFGWERKFFIT